MRKDHGYAGLGAWIALTMLGAGVHSALAQVQRSGGSGGASAQLVQQYQQVVAERTQLQADNAQLKKQLDDTKKQLDAAQKQLNATKAAAGGEAARLAVAQAASQAAKDAAAQSVEQTKARLQELVSRFRDTAVTLRGVESERTQLQQQLAQSRSDYDRCAQRNYELYQLDSDVLDRYEHEGTLSHMARAEPFTRIARTRAENLVDEYKTRAEELRVQKAAPPAPATTPASAPVQFAAPPPSAPTSPAANGTQAPPGPAATAPADASKP